MFKENKEVTYDQGTKMPVNQENTLPLRKRMMWKDKSEFARMPVSELPLRKLDEIQKTIKRQRRAFYFFGFNRRVWEEIIHDEIKLHKKRFAERDAKLKGFIIALERKPGFQGIAKILTGEHTIQVKKVGPDNKVTFVKERVIGGGLFSREEINEARKICNRHEQDNPPPAPPKTIISTNSFNHAPH